MKLMLLTLLVYSPFAEPQLETMTYHAPIEQKTYRECVEAGKSIVKKLQIKYPNVSLSYFCKEVEIPPAGVTM